MFFVYVYEGEMVHLYGHFRTKLFARLAQWHLKRKMRNVALLDWTGARL
jgi:hypothetical protein